MSTYIYKLNGINEFYSGLNNKNYNILLANTKNNIIKMIEIFKNFISNKNDSKFLGLDFEFKRVSKIKREIALFQINLEDSNNDAYICIFYPLDLDKKQNKILLKLLTTKNIIKILHGSESLDIPYLYNQLFNNNIKIINKFSNELYDTKYLCEYSHIENNLKKKCSIYELLLEFKIITKEKYDNLNSIEDITGPIYTVVFDINNINNELIKYALYDVLFLPELIKKFFKKSIIYTKIIPQLSRVIFYHKRNISNYFLNFQNIINNYNNYFIYFENLKDNIKLNEIYYFILYYVNNLNILKLLEITYFKKFIEIIIKYIIYSILTNNKYKIFTNNTLETDFTDIKSLSLNEILLNNKELINYFNIYNNEIINFL